jgi:hypothetical protein
LPFDLLRRRVSALNPTSAHTWAGQKTSPGARIANLIRKSCLALQVALVIAPILFLTPAFARPEPRSLSPRAAAPPTTARQTLPTFDARLILRVYNYARLDPVSLALSEKVATAIFESVGIEVVWMDCSVSRPLSRVSPACESDAGPAGLVMRILPRHMASKLTARDEPLGSAQICTESEPACELNVFYFRVDELAVKGYRADRVLAYVIAHEVAHVLLGPGHSQEGILRGEWTRDDLQRISWGLALDFTKDQSLQLRNAVLRRMGQPAPNELTQAKLVSP